jgi:hypothetical protein
MQLVGEIAVVASVLVLAYQARELAGHTQVANEVAASQAHTNLLFHWKSVIDVFIEHPQLHAYYFGQTSEAPSESDGVRLKVIAEQNADWLEAGMTVANQLGSYSGVEQSFGWSWTGYVAGQLAASPVLRSRVRAHPDENPPLVPLLASYDAAHGGSADHPTAQPAPGADTPDHPRPTGIGS